MKATILTLSLVLFTLAPAALAAVSYSEIFLPNVDIPAVSSYQTHGADMAGMAVTAFFQSAPAETVIWQATGATSGSAVGPTQEWSLSENGDTFASPWTLLYTPAAGSNKGLLTGFRIDGFAAGPGNVGVMFDRTYNGQFGTPDSYRGRDFTYAGPEPAFDTFVTYEQAVGLAGAAPVRDEWRILDVQFRTIGDVTEFATTPPLLAGLDGVNVRSLTFYQDSNNPRLIPEPALLALFSIGALLTHRRRHRA